MGLTGFFFIAYIGRPVLVPIILATIVAILLNPVVTYLCSKNLNRVLAIGISLLGAMILMTALIWFIISQAAKLNDTLPEFKQNFERMFNNVVNWISYSFSISKTKIQDFIVRVKAGGMENSTAMVAAVMGTITKFLALLFLLPVYIFMILYYKPLLLEFIARLFKKEKHHVVAEVLQESKGVIQSYLYGLLIEAVIIAVLNSIGLLILGVHYAILLGILGAILNIIPYIGGAIALALPVIMAFATQSTATGIWVIVVYTVIQFIDNNFIVPKIVASKVRMNALVSLIVVLIGGALWGIPGMFLSIPITAITKVIFDRVETLTPFGFLIGDNQPDFHKIAFKTRSAGKKEQAKAKAQPQSAGNS